MSLFLLLIETGIRNWYSINKRHIKTDLLSRYPASSDVLKILHFASFLDPPFKSKPISDSEIENIKEMLVFEGMSIPDLATPASEPSSGSLKPPVSRL